jgi:hypothetical protein
MSSEQGFRGIPGVPEGWELVHANRIVEAGEWYINAKGKPNKSTLRSWRFLGGLLVWLPLVLLLSASRCFLSVLRT